LIFWQRDGLVPYSIPEKIASGIPKRLIEKYSIYSLEVVLVMAKCAVKK